MNIILLLLKILCFYCQIKQIFGKKFQCKFSTEDDGLLKKMYGNELAPNDGTGELREFVCQLEGQKLFLDKHFLNKLSPASQQLNVTDENNEKHKSTCFEEWTIVERKKPELARIFMLLRKSFDLLKESSASNGTSILREVKNQIIDGAFLIADQLQIPRAHILVLKRRHHLMLLKDLAKLWLGQKLSGKSTEKNPKNNQNDGNDNSTKNDDQDGNDNGNDKNYEEWRRRQREMLQIILSAIDDENNAALKIANGAADGESSKKRRRRKKRELSHLDIYLIVAVVLLCLLGCILYSFCCRPAAILPVKGAGGSASKSANKSSAMDAKNSSSLFNFGFKVDDNYPIYHWKHFFPDM